MYNNLVPRLLNSMEILWEWSQIYKQLKLGHFLSSHATWEQGYMCRSNLLVHTTGISRRQDQLTK